MLDKEAPHDWISEIAECDLDMAFRALFQVLKQDIDIANKLPPRKRRNFTFKLERNDEGTTPTIRITRQVKSPLDTNPETVAEFGLNGNAVRLESPLLKDRLTMIYPKWDDEESRCKLYVNDKRMKVWELSKLALQPAIFG